MLVGTHVLIGKRVYDYIKSTLNIELGKKKFLYGNVKPDIIFRLSSRSHRLKDSLEFVLDEIERLTKIENISSSQFSVDLGVISHFMADFFCSPHYYKYEEFNNISKHLYYEYNLHNEFKKVSKEIPDGYIETDIPKLESKSNIEIIYFLEQLYRANMLSIKNDIYFALKASTLITKNIIENSIHYSSKRIAA